MAVSVTKAVEADRGVVYVLGLSASGDVAQAWLRGPGEGLQWNLGKVGWHRTADVTPTFTNAGPAAMAVTGGNGVQAGWVAHPDDAETQAAESLPITGIRFEATAANQTVRLYTGRSLVTDPVDAGTPA